MAITFKVNLDTVNKLNWRQPYNLTTEGDNFKTTRSTWLPDFIRDNRILHNGDTIVVSGMPALYLKNNYTTGDFGILTVVSGTP
jgi:hypothetical protein